MPVTCSNETWEKLSILYDTGLLVPFIGAGASVPNCTLWKEFVDRLYASANAHAMIWRNEGIRETEASDLSSKASLTMKLVGQLPKTDRLTIFKEALTPFTDHQLLPPPNTQELCKVWWPLVISTNYDDWFFDTWNKHFESRTHTYNEIQEKAVSQAYLKMIVCGRSNADCHRVSNSLDNTDNPILWAIQGFMGGLASNRHEFELSPEKRSELSDQLVIGHEEYRRETFNSTGFRRVLSDIFKSRSLLFIGSSLTENYFHNIFDETVELQGFNENGHFALLKRGLSVPEEFKHKFQINVLEYDDHADVTNWLSDLANEINLRKNRVSAWGINSVRQFRATDQLPNLLVTRSILPAAQPRECILISSGIIPPNGNPYLEPRPKFSEFGMQAARKTKPDFQLEELRIIEGYDPPIWVSTCNRIIAVGARARDASYEEGKRDFRVISSAIENALDYAGSKKISTVHSMIMASGEGRVFSPHLAFIQMIRGYAKWRTGSNSYENLRFHVHLVDPGVLYQLSTNRIKLADIVSYSEIKVWIESYSSRTLIRRDFAFFSPDDLLGKIIENLPLPNSNWFLNVIPDPMGDGFKHMTAEKFSEVASKWTFSDVGIENGSTIQLFHNNHIN